MVACSRVDVKTRAPWRASVSESSDMPGDRREPLVPNDGVMVRPRSFQAYARDGWSAVAGMGGAQVLRVIREAPPLGGGLLPALLGGAVLHLLALGESERDAWFGFPERVDAWLVSPAAETWVELLPVLLMSALVVVALRGALDALLYGRLRDAVSDRVRSGAELVRGGWIAFGGLSLIRLAFVSGTVMFLTPVFRAVARTALEAPTDGRAVAFTSIVVALVIGVLGYFRFVTGVCAAHLAWRPRFFAATLVAGLVAPVRQPGLYLRLYVGWITGFVALHGLAALLVERCLAAHAAGVTPAAAVVGLVAIAGVGCVAAGWADGTLAAIVGHQLGDIGEIGVDDGDGERQHTLDPAPSGVFAGSGEPLVPVSFADALGYRPRLKAAAEWVASGGAPARARPVALRETAAGAREWVGALDAIDEPVDEALVAPTPAPPASREPGLAGLRAEVARANLRTAGGALEVSWRADSSQR